MKFLGFDKVLCLSPHPDDVEYSMSGTILKYKDTHFDIVTAAKQVDIFDHYWDNYRSDFKTITQAQGRISPKLWGNPPPKEKEKKKK